MQGIKDGINGRIQGSLKIIKRLGDDGRRVETLLFGDYSQTSKEYCLPPRREVLVPISRIIIRGDDNGTRMNVHE